MRLCKRSINSRAALVAKIQVDLAIKTGEILKAVLAKIHSKVFDIDDLQREIVKYLPMPDMKQLIAFTENEDAIIEELEGEGFYIQNVAGDGNCFFHALALQLPGLTHEDLRAITIGQILSNPQNYRNFIDEDGIDNYIANMVMQGIWVDHIMIQALVDNLDLSLQIRSLYGAESLTIRSSVALDENSAADIQLLYTGNHYLAILARASKNTEPLVLAEVETTYVNINETDNNIIDLLHNLG